MGQQKSGANQTLDKLMGDVGIGFGLILLNLVSDL